MSEKRAKKEIKVFGKKEGLNLTIYSDIFDEKDKVELFKKELLKELKITEECLISGLILKARR